MIIVVMGVAGSGKTTIGRKLAAALRVGFTDADELHSPASVEKMRAGIALTDADRAPWLSAMRAKIDECGRAGANHVFACSALKARYRELLGGGNPQVRFVYLKGDASLIGRRLRQRTGHFFNPALLASQFEILEEPQDAITVDAGQTPDALVGQVVAALRRGGH